jgi:hypothetical protein
MDHKEGLSGTATGHRAAPNSLHIDAEHAGRPVRRPCSYPQPPKTYLGQPKTLSANDVLLFRYL